MDFALTEDQLAFQHISHQFSLKELTPNAAEWDKNSHFPKKELIKINNITN